MHVMDIAQNAVAAGAANTHIILRMDTATDRLELTMEDDGRGMTDEQARAALDPFYTSRTTRKVGLGLPLLRLTAQLTGGAVAIESFAGKGDPGHGQVRPFPHRPPASGRYGGHHLRPDAGKSRAGFFAMSCM